MMEQHQTTAQLSNHPARDATTIQTLASFGVGPNGQPVVALQQTAQGSGRVVINPDLLKGAGLTMDELRHAMEDARIANQMRNAYDGQFPSRTVRFTDQGPQGPLAMQFEGFLETGLSTRVWRDNVAAFVSVAKARAFFEFLDDNLPRAIAHFPDELGGVGRKLARAGVDIPTHSAPVVPLSEVVERMQERAQPALDQTSAPSASGRPRSPNV